MDVRLPHPSIPERSSIPERGDPHDWKTWDRYQTIHEKRLAGHEFIDHSQPHTLEFVHDADTGRVLLCGRVYCLRGVVLEVDKELETRYMASSLKVRGVTYRYAAWIPGGHPVLRYHNIHYYDDYYHHRVFDPRTGEQVLYERLERYQFPTLSEVIDEIDVVTRTLDTQTA